MTGLIFRDRREAGRTLGGTLTRLTSKDPLVLALPTGGVPVGYEVATVIDAPLDVLPVSRLRAVRRTGPAFGAIAVDGTRVLSYDLVPDLAGLEGPALDQTIERVENEVRRRGRVYHGRRHFPNVAGKDVILVADGIATGLAMVAAAKSVRRRGPSSLVVAAPVASEYARERLMENADDIVCLDNPSAFFGVGCCYMDFDPTSEEEACRLLEDRKRRIITPDVPEIPDLGGPKGGSGSH